MACGHGVSKPNIVQNNECLLNYHPYRSIAMKTIIFAYYFFLNKKICF